MAVLVGYGCGGTTPEDEAERDFAPPPVAADGEVYRTEILGVEEAALQDILTRSSRLVALQAKPPASRTGLVRRAEEDLKGLEKALRSEGYYGAKLSYRLIEDQRPTVVEINISTGPLYRITAYEIIYRPPPEAGSLPTGLEAVGLEPGAPARAPIIVGAQETLLRRIGRIGHPLARVTDRRVVVDRAADTMAVTLTVDPGPRARFGRVGFEGLESVEEGYLRRFIRWSTDDIYDQELVNQFEKRLRETDLFETVKVEKATQVEADGGLPLTVRVAERKHRSIGAGVNFSSSEGIGGEVFWEHRNLLGEQENFRVTATAAEIRQELALNFRKPNYKRIDQALLSETKGTRQETEAFDEVGVSQTLALERKLSERWRVSAGGSVEYTEIDDNEGRQQFTLLGVPLTARRDNTDDPLDPSRGSRLQFDVTPYQTFGDDESTFLRTEVAGSIYYSVLRRRRFVVAGRAKIGSIVGSQTDDVPATKRFYAGGGGSIRGFEFQEVGPLDGAGDPLGGRSVVEVGLDLRFRLTDTIGIVPFVEAGNVYDEEVPNFSDPLRVGAGLGFRYFTAIGPLRLDVAVPVNPREGVDEDFQFYISLGQAF